MFAGKAYVAFVALLGSFALAADADDRAQCCGIRKEPKELEARSVKIIPGGTTRCPATHTVNARGAEEIKTKWHTHTTRVCDTITSTCTGTTTSTPVTSTTTATRIVTTTVTDPTSTATATFTTTDTVTDTSTSVVTESTTTTTTTTVSTTTFAASPGFIPVQSSLPGSGYGGSGGPVAGRFALPDTELNADNITFSHKYELNDDFYSIPRDLEKIKGDDHWKGLDCHVTHTEKCTSTTCTTATTTVTLATPLVASTVTSTSTTTTTPIFQTSTTITSTTTTVTTSISTTTSTATETETELSPNFTFYYEPCQSSSNYADEVLGSPITGAIRLTGNPGRVFTLDNYASAQDCCNYAFLEFVDNAVIFAYDPSTRQCMITAAYPGECPTGQFSHQYGADLSSPFVVTVGNGYCAEFTVAE